jgi:hypothetical protein
MNCMQDLKKNVVAHISRCHLVIFLENEENHGSCHSGRLVNQLLPLLQSVSVVSRRNLSSRQLTPHIVQSINRAEGNKTTAQASLSSEPWSHWWPAMKYLLTVRSNGPNYRLAIDWPQDGTIESTCCTSCLYARRSPPLTVSYDPVCPSSVLYLKYLKPPITPGYSIPHFVTGIIFICSPCKNVVISWLYSVH